MPPGTCPGWSGERPAGLQPASGLSAVTPERGKAGPRRMGGEGSTRSGGCPGGWRGEAEVAPGERPDPTGTGGRTPAPPPPLHPARDAPAGRSICITPPLR